MAADCQNCGCDHCKCGSNTGHCVIVDYSYVVDPDKPFSRKFNQEGTPEALVRDALQRAHKVVIARSKIPKKCLDELCAAINAREESKGDICPSPCQQALIDKLTRCIIEWAIYEYVKDIGHHDFRNPGADKPNFDEQLKIFAFYEKEAEGVLANEDIENFLLTAKKSDYDSNISNDNNEEYCFDCIDRTHFSSDCLPVKKEDNFDIPLAFI